MAYKDSDTFGNEPKEAKNRLNNRYPDEDRVKNENYTKGYNPNIVSETYLDGTSVYHDTTKGSERYRFHHSSGTGWDILKDGFYNLHVNGNAHQYFKEGLNTTVQGNSDYKVGGHARTNISGGLSEHVKGNRDSFTGGSVGEYVVGNRNQHTTGTMSIASEKSITFSAKGKGIQGDAPVRFTLGSDGTIFVTGAKHVNIVGGEEVQVTAATNIGLKASNISLSADNDIQMKAQNIRMQAENEMHIKSKQFIRIGGDDCLSVEVVSISNAATPPFGGGGQPPLPASPQVDNHAPEEKPATQTDAPYNSTS
jgi:hypothetical protein